MRKWVKYILFLNSYTPLLIIFVIKKLNYDKLVFPTSLNKLVINFKIAFDNLFLGYSVIVVIIMSNMILWDIFKESKSITPRKIEAKTVNLQNSASLNYIATYIIPFLEVDLGKTADIVSLILLFIVMGFIYVNSNLIYTNPTLMFVGYSIFEIETNNQRKIIVIHKGRSPNINKKLSIIELTENIYLGRNNQ